MNRAPFDLTDKVAVITGSTRGIGRAIAEHFLSSGAEVVVSNESPEETQQAAAELGVTGIPCDVTREDNLQALVDGTVAAHGGIDILVCNAGITGKGGTWDVDDFDRVMAVNLRSQIKLTSIALPHIAARKGSVILMASLSAMRGNAAINGYALSKAGVVQLARNLAVQWGPKGVRVNAISPGFIATDFSKPLLDNEAFMKKRMAMTPLRRPGTVDDVAGAALFLASDAAAFVTGHNLIVDGGTAITDGS
jgi:NAD(P)-dependent dehydrogenase (short-subunit alcohol dehydrogenase family)